MDIWRSWIALIISFAQMIVVGSFFLATGAYAQSNQLKPFKDELFAYPSVLEKEMDGAFLRLDYRIQRDLRDRDDIPEKKVQARYVSSKPSWYVRDQSAKLAGKRRKHVRVGSPSDKTKLVVLYIHGKGGNRKQGNANWTFGGNFNRLKNLMIRNDGVYLVQRHRSWTVSDIESGVLGVVEDGRSPAEITPKISRRFYSCGW